MKKKNKNEIVVKGQKIQAKIEEIDIFKLHYWKENPRVNSVIKQKYGGAKDVSDEIIEELMWDNCESVKDLYKDIEKQGGLIDEILVKNDTVLEGNSRLCAYRHLYKKAQEKNNEEEMLNWSYIRSRVIPSDTSDEVIFSILGTWHIKGKAEWDTYEKAAYLKRMTEDYGYSIKEVSDTISKPEKFVRDHIKAYDLMIENKVFDLDKFSYFYEFIINKNIKDEMEKDISVFNKTTSYGLPHNCFIILISSSHPQNMHISNLM